MQPRAVIVGAGIVGLHVACALCKKGYEVYVLERDDTLGEQSSGRNSGVIHAGIFYEMGSLKEKTCIAGNRLTYEWLQRLQVPYQVCGKWLVPESGQEAQLELFYQRLCSLPIPRPTLLTAKELKDREPELRTLPAIDVPSTGIVDAASYVKALAVYLENSGVTLLTHCDVQAVDGQSLQTSRGPIDFDIAINAAGLFADQIAQGSGMEGYEVRPCRGDYYVFPQALLSRPVYHLPYQGAPGLGVHLTPTLDGQILVGPNAFFIKEKLDYQHGSSPEAFEKALHYYLPQVARSRLQPAYGGNRPKLFYQGAPVSDFVLVRREPWIHLLGIESPGLTAAPALAREVVQCLR